jgi:hypothetical protein
MSLDLIVATGSYTGNGGTQSISIGWQPAVVMTFDTKGGTPNNRACSLKLPDMAGDDVLLCSTTAVFLTANGLTIVSDGFDLGSDQRINGSGDTYHWVAFRAGPWIDTGTYTGDDPTAVTVTTGRQPGAVLAGQVSGTIAQFWKMAVQAGATVAEFITTVISVNGITIQSTGFQASDNANDVGETFDWAALYPVPGSTRHFETGEYTGNGVNPQAIALGAQPRAVFVFDVANVDLFFKTDTMASADVADLTTAYAFDTSGNGITLSSTGFSVGSLLNTNTSTYQYMAIYE